jgi:two-component system sensor histidine kinase VicK
VAVEDGGAAIPPAEFELLFEKFYRRERGHARSTYGYGLGLHIVRQLARAMGGDAWGESRDGAGNRFVFSLPVMEEEHEDPDRRR